MAIRRLQLARSGPIEWLNSNILECDCESGQCYALAVFLMRAVEDRQDKRVLRQIWSGQGGGKKATLFATAERSQPKEANAKKSERGGFGNRTVDNQDWKSL